MWNPPFFYTLGIDSFWFKWSKSIDMFRIRLLVLIGQDLISIFFFCLFCFVLIIRRIIIITFQFINGCQFFLVCLFVFKYDIIPFTSAYWKLIFFFFVCLLKLFFCVCVRVCVGVPLNHLNTKKKSNPLGVLFIHSIISVSVIFCVNQIIWDPTTTTTTIRKKRYQNRQQQQQRRRPVDLKI